MSKTVSSKAFWLVIALVLSIITSYPAIGLVVGIGLALFFGNPQKDMTGTLSKKLLQLSVILLGFGMQISVILKVGLASIGITFSSILMTFIIGIGLCRIFNIEQKLSILLTSGTAVCGGSAIAAMAPAIGASQSQTAVAMAVVFILNAIGLILFPFLGHAMGMSQEAFGLWAAIAIHDTSSVVGAGAAYGVVASSIAITVKLTRALWIFPLALAGTKLSHSHNEKKPPFQWFLIGFLLAGIITSLFPSGSSIWSVLSAIGKHMMTGTLFLVGSCLTFSELRRVGMRSLSVSLLLWVIISILSLIAINTGIWHIPEGLLNK